MSNVIRFKDAEEAWFWALECEKYRQSGARFSAGLGLPRPCDPADIFIVIKRLYDSGKIKTDHILTLRHFGLGGTRPDPEIYGRGRCSFNGRDERGAFKLWREAMKLLDDELAKKDILEAA